MAGISSFTTISRDNIIRLVQAPNFFDKNPALKPHEEALHVCQKNYIDAKKKSSCGCNGAGKKMFTPCVEAILQQLEGEKETNPAAVSAFVQYLTQQTVGSNRVKVTVYYTKNNGARTHKYEFVA